MHPALLVVTAGNQGPRWAVVGREESGKRKKSAVVCGRWEWKEERGPTLP
jgi:hypothetical protein